jgi:hypothetical protein
MKPTNAGVIPKAAASRWTDSTKTSAHQCDRHGDAASIARAKPIDQGAWPASSWSAPPKISRCVLRENNSPDP